MIITKRFKKRFFACSVLKKCYNVKDIMYLWGKESRIQRTIPSQYIYVAELDATLNDALFLPVNNTAIFLQSRSKKSILNI